MRPELCTPARVAGVSAVILAVTSLPYVFGFLSAPADLVYTGLMFDVPDHAQYWSWVTASRDGLFIANAMTPEPNAPIFMNPWMWLLAKAQVAFGLSFPTLFQCWRALSCVLLVWALLAFADATVPDPARRRTALLLAGVGSGFGWVYLVAKYTGLVDDVPFPHDVYTVEPNTFLSVLSYPYVPLAYSLIICAILCGWRAHVTGRAVYAVGTALAAVALALFHAYDLITVYTVLAALGAVSWVTERRFPKALFATGLVMGCTSGPIALYYSQLTSHDPLWQAILAQYPNAGVWTPPHLHLVMLMGVPLLLAIWGLSAARSYPAYALVATWALVTSVLIYVPTVFQIKMLAGWQFPLAVLGAHAWHDRAWPRLAPMLTNLLPGGAARAAARPWVSALVLVALIAPTNAYLFAWRFTELARHQAPYFLHADEMTALEWLAAHSTPEDIAIAPLAVGQFVPNYGRTRAYLAHWAMTNRFFERRAAVDEFFDAATPDGRRRAIVDADRVTLVLESCPSAERCDASPLERTAWLEPVLRTGRARVYRYTPAHDAGAPTS